MHTLWNWVSTHIYSKCYASNKQILLHALYIYSLTATPQSYDHWTSVNEGVRWLYNLTTNHKLREKMLGKKCWLCNYNANCLIALIVMFSVQYYEYRPSLNHISNAYHAPYICSQACMLINFNVCVKCAPNPHYHRPVADSPIMSSFNRTTFYLTRGLAWRYQLASLFGGRPRNT